MLEYLLYAEPGSLPTPPHTGPFQQYTWEVFQLGVWGERTGPSRHNVSVSLCLISFALVL